MQSGNTFAEYYWLGEGMTGGIFVSYQREDSQHAAGRLVDRLTQSFGKDRIFMDVDAIEPGLKVN